MEPTDATATGGAAQTMEGVTPTPGATAKPAKKPTVCLFMGMAGSGKTTLVQRLNLHLNEKVGCLSYPDPWLASIRPIGNHSQVRHERKQPCCSPQSSQNHPYGPIVRMPRTSTTCTDMDENTDLHICVHVLSGRSELLREFGPSCDERALRCQHRHSRHGRLQGSHGAVSAGTQRSYHDITQPFCHPVRPGKTSPTSKSDIRLPQRCMVSSNAWSNALYTGIYMNLDIPTGARYP